MSNFLRAILSCLSKHRSRLRQMLRIMDAVEAVLQCIFSTACFRQGILFSLSRKHVADIAGFFIFGL